MSSTPKALTPTSSEGGSPPREDAAGRQVDEPPSVVEEGTESIQPITEPQDDDDVDHVGTNEEAAAAVAPQGEEGEAGAQASSGDAAADDAETIIEDRLAAAEAAALAIEGQAEQVTRDLKAATAERDRLRRALDEAEKQKAQIQPAYERALANAELRDRAESLKQEIVSEETALRQLDHEIRSLDKQLAAASGAYRAERSAVESVAAQLRALLLPFNEAVDEKIGFVEDDPDWTPLDELEANGQLTQVRERAFTTLQKQTREASEVCEMKTQELANLEASTAATLQQVREQRDDAIRAMIYDTQDERNRLLMCIEELITTNADQALNLKQGHEQRQAPDRAFTGPTRDEALEGGRSSSKSTTASTSARRTRLRPTPTEEPQVAFIAAKNKELASDIAVLKAEMAKMGEQRTDAIQSTKKLEQQMKRDKEQYQAQLQKLETEIVAEQLRLRAIQKEVSKTATSVEQLTAVLKTSKRHQDNTRIKTAPLPVE